MTERVVMFYNRRPGKASGALLGYVLRQAAYSAYCIARAPGSRAAERRRKADVVAAGIAVCMEKYINTQCQAEAYRLAVLDWCGQQGIAAPEEFKR